MLQAKLSQCNNCQSPLETINLIDCRLAYFAENSSKNIFFEAGLYHPKDIIDLLIFYKGILQKRMLNPAYVCDYPLAKIVSRVKTLIHK